MLQSMGLPRIRQDLATEQQWLFKILHNITVGEFEGFFLHH